MVNGMTKSKVLPIQSVLAAMPRGSDRTEKIYYSCMVPNKHVNINSQSDCFLCHCEAWLPISVGKVQDFKTLDDVFSSTIAEELRADVAEKKYTWCAVNHCGIVNSDKDPGHYSISINIDESCNLACPSCRTKLIAVTSGPNFDSKVEDVKRIIEWLTAFDKPLHITLTGNGDPFASQIIRNLIHIHVPKVNQTFKILTNGLLIKKQLPGSSIAKNITEFSISVDAGTKEVYEDVRRPGKWKILLENLDWLSDKGYRVQLNFVLQKKNFRDLLNFVNLCNKYNYFGIISKLENWGTFDYNENNVLDKDHVDYQECVNMIKQVMSTNNKKIIFSPIFRNLVL
jgi:MoaA/NifB/PqqE/SkfB family radical SAM enzyme